MAITAVFRADDAVELTIGLGLLIASVAIGTLFTFSGADFLGGDRTVSAASFSVCWSVPPWLLRSRSSGARRSSAV